MDPLSSALVVFGLILLAGSWLLLLQISFSEDFTWGLATLFAPPLSYLYGCFAWQKSKDVIWVAVLGLLLVLCGSL